MLHFNAMLTLRAITDFGDSGLLSGVVLAGALYLALARCTRGALSLLLAFASAVGFIGLMKIAFLGCSAIIHLDAVESPSGHTALATAVYGTFAMLIASQYSVPRRYIPFLIALPLIALIAASRVALGYHSINEVILGFAAGYGALLVTHFHMNHGRPIESFHALRLMLYMLAALLLCHGLHLPAEEFIRRISTYFGHYAPACAGAAR